ncbi:MAG: nucleoside/nucleotide kinase family protein [Rhizobiales bacterium]|nr:nucleoside/nucleotide kinase family protein [Hyphomicrobiales bacterium]
MQNKNRTYPNGIGQTNLDGVIEVILSKKTNNQRLVVAIVGPPGSGKSTLSELICDRLNALATNSSAILPMDGFHLDNNVLSDLQILSKKGAPESFDSDGFKTIMTRICKANKNVIVPIFDRMLDLSRAGGRVIPLTTEIVLVEGNYLLLKRPEWIQCHANFDLTISINVSMNELKKRLIQRWLDYGLSTKQALERTISNDIPNAKIVLNESSPADINFHMSRWHDQTVSTPS